jgi:hypothetical protein
LSEKRRELLPLLLSFHSLIDDDVGLREIREKDAISANDLSLTTATIGLQIRLSISDSQFLKME